MELTWLAGTSLLLVGVGYAFVQKAPRFRLVCWGLLCASLFALATRDLFRPQERGRPAPASSAESSTRPDDRTDSNDRPDSDDRTGSGNQIDSDDDRNPTPLFARLRGRVTGWFG